MASSSRSGTGAMCGRYAITLPPQAMRGLFTYVEQPNFPPRYNVAPTQPVPIVRTFGPGPIGADPARAQRHFALVRWGFLPSFVKDVKAFPLIINARAETIAEKPSFRAAIRRRRCLFIMDGYYEWRRDGHAKSQPFLIRRVDRAAMGVAGLWETLMTPDGSEIDSACLVTTAANGVLAGIHERMPVVLEPDDFPQWLDPDETRYGEALRLLRPAANTVMEFVAIGTAVNKVGNDGPQVQVPVDAG